MSTSNDVELTESTVIPLGVRILSGLHLHLLLNINMQKRINGYRFTLSVPVSNSYPKSKLFTSAIVVRDGLFKAIIDTTDNNNKCYCDAQNTLGFSTSLCLYIRSMWIVGKCNDIEIMAEERNMLLGLERNVFSLGLQYLTNRYQINIDDTMIMYNINEPCSINEPKVINYLQLDYETLAEYYNNICPNKTIKRLTTTHEELARRIVSHEKGRKMYLYLSTILGMQRISEESVATLLSVFLDKCLK